VKGGIGAGALYLPTALNKDLRMHLFLLALGCGDPDDTATPCTETAWFLDADGDGHGGDERIDACEAPAGYTAQSTDCDDDDATANPDGTEVCDGADNDCNGEIDDDATDAVTFYADADGDGFGDAATPVMACEEAEGVTADDTDCDDTAATAYPGADEICDGLDNSCDGETDGVLYPGDFASLAEAVDATDPGGLLCIAAGDYDESLHLEGEDIRVGGFGVDQTRLNGTGTSTAALVIYDSPGSEVFHMSFLDARLLATDGVTLRSLEVSGSDGSRRAMEVDDTTATFEDVDFVDHHLERAYAGTFYGLLFVEDSELTWTGGRFADNSMDLSSTSGTFLRAEGIGQFKTSTVTLDGVVVEDNLVTVENNGAASGVLYAFNEGVFLAREADLSFVDVDFKNNEGHCVSGNTQGTASSTCRALWSIESSSTLHHSGGEMSGNLATSDATTGAYVTLTQNLHTEVTTSDVRVFGNELDASGAYGSCVLLANQNVVGDWTRVSFIDNRVDCGQGEAYGMMNNTSGETTLQNTVMTGNELTTEGVAYVLLRFHADPIRVVNSTFHGNEVHGDKAYSGVFYLGSNEDYAFQNNVVSENSLTTNETTGAYYGAAVLWSFAVKNTAYNSFVGNTSTSGNQFADHSKALDLIGTDNNAALEPDYVDVSDADPLNWDLSLQSGSALIDAGDPSIDDADGTTSDIGAYGGPQSF
jgi:hypothetical protein